MKSNYQQAALFKYLKKRNESLAARVVNVRTEVEKWLPYILTSFPHYPQHGVEHSDRILGQLSQLLFQGNTLRPQIGLSSSEIYCLLCSIYLHDIGMVVTQRKIDEIFSSKAWNELKAPGGKFHDAFVKYETLRQDPTLKDSEHGVFLANTALKLIVAEFVRINHHEFGKAVLEMHPFLKRWVDDGDSITFDTIADIGVAHGLNSNELSDPNRFPEERLVLGEKVNVRFLSRLLRIGDLLDVSTARADPLSAEAVAPLPPDTIPHWAQYSAKKHENISPKTIEFRFECKDQETHRVLRDWFGWLESEVSTTGLEQMHSARHQNWIAPLCTVGSYSTYDSHSPKSGPTIVIIPTRGAEYTFHEWKLEFDHEKILHLLVRDIYDNPSVFVRELVQNSLDATRCQMYKDFEEQNPGISSPADPSDFSEEFRNRYPIQLSVHKQLISHQSEAPEERMVFTIEDMGTGMDEGIITRYFLQIGRSYYNSKEFTEKFRFAPTSRFGIGFLSVFGVSNNIILETVKQTSRGQDPAGIRLRLSRPENYLLTEKWNPFPERISRNRHGTKIKVVINRECSEIKLLELIRSFCVQVEIPIKVTEGTKETKVTYTSLPDGQILSRIQNNPSNYFVQRAFNIDANGVRGQLLLCAYVDENGEAWCDCAPNYLGLDNERIDKIPALPEEYLALHGISAGYAFYHERRSSSLWSSRLDIRSSGATIPASRIARRTRRLEILYPNPPSTIDMIGQKEVELAAEKLVASHLSTCKRAEGKSGYYYVGRVLGAAPISSVWRNNYPDTVVTWRSQKRVNCSANDLLSLTTLYLVYTVKPSPFPLQRVTEKTVPISSVNLPHPVVSFRDTPVFIDKDFQHKIETMNLISVNNVENLWLLEFGEEIGNGIERAFPDVGWWLVDLPKREEGTLSPAYGSAGKECWALFNRSNPYVRWLMRVREAIDQPSKQISETAVRAAWKCFVDEPYRFDELMERWARNGNLDKHFHPPETQVENGKKIVHRVHTSWLQMEPARTLED